MKLCLVTIVATALIALILSKWSRFKKRTWDEYYAHLREFDWNEAKDLFDREEEDRLESIARASSTSGIFRREQRSRLELAREMVGRSFHNTRLSFEWVYTEFRDMVNFHLEYEPAVVEAMEKVIEESRRFMWIARYDLAYMWLLSLTHFDEWRFMPVPSVVALRKVFDADVLQSYRRVKMAVVDFARLVYSQDEVDYILAKM